MFRLEDIEHGNCVIKRDTRRCHVAIVDDLELQNAKKDLEETRKHLVDEQAASSAAKKDLEETRKNLVDEQTASSAAKIQWNEVMNNFLTISQKRKCSKWTKVLKTYFRTKIS